VKPLALSFSASRFGQRPTLGQFIRKARLETELSQRDVAEGIGVDEMTIVNWERYATLTTPRRSP
jgi:transcriptional regulator with XRE-family HTH domain